jgi:hypothetical protein
MRIVLILPFLAIFFQLKAQSTDRQLIYGTWQIEAIALDTIKLPLISVENFTKSVIQSKLKLGKPPKQREADSISLAFTAAILHAQFQRLQLTITNNSEWIFNYYVELMGDDRPNIVPTRFAFRSDKNLLLIDDNWREEVIHLISLNEKELVFEGLSQALGVKLYFNRIEAD